MIAKRRNEPPPIVAEDKKLGARRSELSQCSSVQDRTHRMLANSKMIFLPSKESRVISPASGKVSSVLVEGERSVEPPTNHGCFLAIAFSTLPEESLLAIPFASGGNIGISESQPCGGSRR